MTTRFDVIGNEINDNTATCTCTVVALLVVVEFMKCKNVYVNTTNKHVSNEDMVVKISLT